MSHWYAAFGIGVTGALVATSLILTDVSASANEPLDGPPTTEYVCCVDYLGSCDTYSGHSCPQLTQEVACDCPGEG